MDPVRPDPDPDRPEPAELSRSDLRTLRGALRQDWPIPDDVKQRLLQSVINLADTETVEGAMAGSRTRLAAMKVIVSMARLQLGQQALDLQRERGEAARSETQTVADAMKVVEQIERGLEAQ